MKFIAILFLCASSAVAVPLKGDDVLAAQIVMGGGDDFDFVYSLPGDDQLGLPNMNQIRQGFQHVGDSLGNTLAPILGVVKNNPFVQALKQILTDQVALAGEAMEGVLTKLVISTSSLADKILDKTTQQNILTTFGVTGATGSPLTDFSSIEVKGDKLAITTFKDDLTALLAAQQEGATHLQVLAGLEMNLLELLVNNKVVKMTGAIALQKIFNIENIINAATHPVQTVKNVTDYLGKLQAEIPKKAHAFANFLSSLTEGVKSMASGIGQVTETIAANVVKGTLEFLLKSNVLNDGGYKRLVATFVPGMESLTAVLKTETDVKSLPVYKADTNTVNEFYATITALVGLKNTGTSATALLAGVEAAAIDLVVATNLAKLSAVTPILYYLGLGEMGNVIRLAANVVAKGKGRIMATVQGINELSKGINSFIDESVKSGRKLSMEGLSISLNTVLNLALNNKIKSLFSTEVSNQLKVTFAGAAIEGVNALTTGDVASVKINSNNEDAKTAFLTTLEALVEQVGSEASQEAKITALAGVNMAVIDLLSANTIMEINVALNLKELLAA